MRRVFLIFPALLNSRVACDAVLDDLNQYAITWGAQDLREALARKVEKYNNMLFNPETEITVTCGSTEAMIASMLAIIQQGDEVIVPEPFDENYGPDAQISLGAADARSVSPGRRFLSSMKRHGNPHLTAKHGQLS